MTLGSRLAFCFPGQGSQALGMGRALSEAFPAARATFEEASDAIGIDLARLCFEGPEAALQLTANTQPAVLTVSVAVARVLREVGLSPGIVAGHSLGEYAALVAAEALAFPDAVRLVRRRGEFMQDAVPVDVGAMAAILGVDLAVVSEVCREVMHAADGTVVEVANVNAPGQVVIAGHRSAVEQAVTLVATRGGRRSMLLPVSAPFHCRLMGPAAERLAAVLDAVPTADPVVPVVRNVDAGLTTRAEDVRPFLVRQVTAPVLWTDSVARMVREGATVHLEAGPGRVLTGLLRRIDGSVQGLAVEDPEAVAKAVAAVGA